VKAKAILRPPVTAHALHALACDCEALLFVSREPLSLEQLAALTNVSTESVRKAIRQITRMFQQCGIELCSSSQGYFFSPVPRTNGAVKAYHEEPSTLSDEAMETLAAIAYLQPIDEAGIADVRLQDPSHALETLIKAGLTERILDTDGIERYITTKGFLDSARLSCLDELPYLLPSQV
jgi:segregation and condensation protein B